MESTLLLLTPFVISFLTQVVKRIKAVTPQEPGGFRNTFLRLVAVALSFGAALVLQYVGDGDVDVMTIQTFATTLVGFLGSTGVYFFAKEATK